MTAITRDARADVAFVSAAKDISVNSSDESIEKTPLSQRQTKNGPKSAVNDERSAINRTLNLQTTVGAFLETIEVQVAIVLLIAFDVCCTALEIHLRDQHEMIRLYALMETAATSMPSSTVSSVPIATPSMTLQVATRLVESFTGFTVVFFLIELLVLIGAFQKQFFSHFGYVLDLGVVIGALMYEIYTQSKALRLLGVLRIWRVFRVVSTLLERERNAHDVTRDVLEEEQMVLNVHGISLPSCIYQLQLEKQAAEDSLKREIDSRGGLEKLLQGYKDEVETLKEALNIAAEAVAEASISATNYHQYEDEDAPLPEDQSQGTGGEAVDPYSDYYDQQQYDAAGYESYYADPNAEAYSEPLDGEESRGAEAVVGPHLVSTEAEKLTQDDEFEDAVEH